MKRRFFVWGCLLVGINLLLSNNVLGQKFYFSEWKNLTKSGALPPQCNIQESNNNLDLVKFKDDYFLAFRTAPSHFASKKTVIYVVKTRDFESWSYETKIELQCDLREPRFFVFNDSLHLVFFTGGTNMFKFEPKEMLKISYGGNSWSSPISLGLDGYVPWRVREKNGLLYMSAYYGVGIYSGHHDSDLRLFVSKNGYHWTTLTPYPQIKLPHAEEGEFIFDSKGKLWATCRLESNGSLLCYANPGNIETWQCVRSKYKYDSALMFLYNDKPFVIARRNMDGEMDKTKNRKSEKQGRSKNLIRYSITEKVTALYKLEQDSNQLVHIVDFPSSGDNAYPALVWLDNKTAVVMNYSCDINARKKSWLSGQLDQTFLYWTVMKIED